MSPLDLLHSCSLQNATPTKEGERESGGGGATTIMIYLTSFNEPSLSPTTDVSD